MAPPGPWDKELWGQRVEKTLSPSMENQSEQDSKRGCIKTVIQFQTLMLKQGTQHGSPPCCRVYF